MWFLQYIHFYSASAHIMKFLVLTVAVFSLFCGSFIQSASLPNLQKELYIYRSQIRLVYDLLVKECPEKVRSKREVLASTDLEIQQLHYKSMLKLLFECRHSRTASTDRKTDAVSTETQSVSTNTSAGAQKTFTTTTATPTTTTPTTTTTTPTTTTTVIPTTTTTTTEAVPITPEECLTARNLSEAWRSKYKKSNVWAGSGDIEGSGSGDDEDFSEYSVCDFQSELQWFRFTGAAGEHISCYSYTVCITIIAPESL